MARSNANAYSMGCDTAYACMFAAVDVSVSVSESIITWFVRAAVSALEKQYQCV